MLRSRFLVDIDCWSEARGQPIKPGDICRVAREALESSQGRSQADSTPAGGLARSGRSGGTTERKGLAS
jgi:hypothetical protein